MEIIVGLVDDTGVELVGGTRVVGGPHINLLLIALAEESCHGCGIGGAKRLGSFFSLFFCVAVSLLGRE